MLKELEQIREALNSCKEVVCNGGRYEYCQIYDEVKVESAIVTLDKLIKEHGWQPIETAPKDGAEVLLACWNWQIPVVGSYDEEDEEWFSFNRYYEDCIVKRTGEAFKPTHWMPLPHPPLNNTPEGDNAG